MDFPELAPAIGAVALAYPRTGGARDSNALARRQMSQHRHVPDLVAARAQYHWITLSQKKKYHWIIRSIGLVSTKKEGNKSWG